MPRRSKQRAVTVVRELGPNVDADQWRRSMRTVNGKIWSQVAGYDASSIETLHHMSCCVVSMHAQHYVIFEANVDGTVDSFLRTLCSRCPDFVGEAFGQCVGAPNGPAGDWRSFLKRGLRPYGIFHIGNTGRRMSRIQEEARLLNKLAQAARNQTRLAYSRGDAWRRIRDGMSAADMQVAEAVDPLPLLVKLNPFNRRRANAIDSVPASCCERCWACWRASHASRWTLRCVTGSSPPRACGASSDSG